MKKDKNAKRTIVITIISIMLFAYSSSYSFAELPIQGFYPVSSKGDFCSAPNPKELPHNALYKNWCQKFFKNGSYIYEAYRQIAFNVKYTPEPPRVDMWQTPFETMSRHAGDCEDAILLFHNLLASQYIDGEIIWGLVFDVKKNTGFAHVWYQLYDKNGNAYVVEPFSGDWNGIIPVDYLSDSEIRQRIVGLPTNTIREIMNEPSKRQMIKALTLREIMMYDWRHIDQVDDVFTKLAQVSDRHRKQISN